MIEAASVIHVAPHDPDVSVAYWRFTVPLEVLAPALKFPPDVLVPLNTGRTDGEALFVAIDVANLMITVPDPPLLPADVLPPAPPPPVAAVAAVGVPAPDVPAAPPPEPPEPAVWFAPAPPPPPPRLSAVPRMCHSAPSAPLPGQLLDEHDPDDVVQTPLPPLPPFARMVPPDAVPPAPPELLSPPTVQMEPDQRHPFPPLPPLAVSVVPPAVTEEFPPDPPAFPAQVAPEELAVPPAPIVIVIAPLTGSAEW